MNFQKITSVPNSKDLLDIAFRKAREKGKSKKLSGNWLQIIRKKEALKLDIIKDVLDVKLDKILTSYPDLDTLPKFYIKLMEVTLDYPKFRKSLGAINWAKERIKHFQGMYVRRIVKEKDRSKINEISKQFYGRISSVLKQIEKNLKYLEESRKTLKTYPDIKEMYTVCLYGFPNVGKSTLLNKMTGTKAQTAAYAFTTKTINSGHITIEGKEVQILDVPGTLAREEKMNNVEKQADLVLNELANMVIYVFDITERCGYTIDQQERLYQQLRKNDSLVIYLSKQDLLSKEEIKGFKHKHLSLVEIKEKIGIKAAELF